MITLYLLTQQLWGLLANFDLLECLNVSNDNNNFILQKGKFFFHQFTGPLDLYILQLHYRNNNTLISTNQNLIKVPKVLAYLNPL